MTTRKIVLSIITLFIVNYSMGQTKKVALGLGLEPSINWLKTNSSQLEANGNRLGFNYGLIADFNFGENYAFATGLFINNGGGKVKSSYKLDSLSYSVEQNLKIQSIRIPIALRMMTKEIGYFRYYGLFGFQFDYVINASVDQKVNGGSEEKDVDVRKDVSPVNLSLSLGAGLMYNLSGTTNFVIGLTFNNGFIDMLEGSAGDGKELKATANQIALNLGILF